MTQGYQQMEGKREVLLYQMWGMLLLILSEGLHLQVILDFSHPTGE